MNNSTSEEGAHEMVPVEAGCEVNTSKTGSTDKFDEFDELLENIPEVVFQEALVEAGAKVDAAKVVPVCNKTNEVSKPRVRNKQEASLKEGRQMDEAEVVPVYKTQCNGSNQEIQIEDVKADVKAAIQVAAENKYAAEYKAKEARQYLKVVEYKATKKFKRAREAAIEATKEAAKMKKAFENV